MPYTRHLNNVVETDTEVIFDLVVRDEKDHYTYGGGRVTLRKPISDAQLDSLLDVAIASIVDRGDAAFPKGPPEQRPNDNSAIARKLTERVRARNRSERA